MVPSSVVRALVVSSLSRSTLLAPCSCFSLFFLTSYFFLLTSPRQLRKSGSQISSECHHTSLMPRHQKYLFLQHICVVEKTSHRISHFGCPILNLLRRGRNFVQQRRPQLHVMTMDHCAGGWI